MPEFGAALLIKLVGAFFGAALALVFVPPRTYRGFIRRAVASLIGGVIFAAPVSDLARFSDDLEGLLAAACLAAFASWWAMGTLIRILRAWNWTK